MENKPELKLVNKLFVCHFKSSENILNVVITLQVYFGP